MSQAWIVRAGKHDEYEQLAFEDGVVAIGWGRAGDLTPHRTQTQLAKLVERTYPEVSRPTREAYAVQLYAFRCVIQPGDVVVLLRGNAPEVAIGEVTGEYGFRPDLPAHVRPVKWLRPEVRPSELGADLLDPPALSVVYRIGRPGALARLRAAAGSAPVRPAPPPATMPVASAADNLRRNLDYARNLTAAGSHLEKLGVSLFEVTDVYRAAWVQAVAALDHWAHKEIYERMLALSDRPDGAKPEHYHRFELPLSAVEEVRAGRRPLRDALAEHLRAKLEHETYQNPRKLKEGFKHVSDVTDLWGRVATVLGERAGTGAPFSGAEVQRRLSEVVHRRNKIAHEYDEDPGNPPAKRSIDAAGTMQTIDWIHRVAEAILLVLDQEPHG